MILRGLALVGRACYEPGLNRYLGATDMINWSRQTQVAVNVETTAALLTSLESHLRDGQGFSVATLNLDHVVKMRSSPDFLEAYSKHSHITADGNPIVWLSRLSGHQIDLVPGSELIDPVCDIANSLDMPVAFLGSTQASLDETTRVLKSRYPGLQVTAQIAPEMGFDPTGPAADACIEQLQASGARVCFLALGAPKQEIFASYAAPKLAQTGFFSIGAGLDFISGTQTRAPKLAQALALEWLWRLLSNPGRFAGRYGKCIALLPGLLRDALRARNVASRS